MINERETASAVSDDQQLHILLMIRKSKNA